jgi:hypothetical protein
MTVLTLTEPHFAAPRRRGGFVKWLWIGLAAIVCSLVGVLEFGVMGVVEIADELPVAMALATAAEPVQAGSGVGYIDHAEWATSGGRPSLRVYPTAAGRQVSSRLVGPGRAWAEVLKLVPNADSPGMREQFACHWRFAEFGKPGKTSWNLEPWRPLVGDITMIASRCNPGGNEESY